MNILLILLFILTIATFFARQGEQSAAGALLLTPLMIMFGFIISPNALGLLLPSTVQSLIPGLQVAIFWIPFLVGLRFVDLSRQSFQQSNIKRSCVVMLLEPCLMTILALASIFVFQFLPLQGTPKISTGPELLAYGLIFGGLFASSGYLVAKSILESGRYSTSCLFVHKYDGLMTNLFCLLGLALLFRDEMVSDLIPLSLMPVLIGGVLAMCVRLIIDLQEDQGPAGWLTLTGLAALGAGWAIGARAPEAIVGFCFGAFLGPLYQRPIDIETLVAKSERPVRLVIATLAGMIFGITEYAICLAVILCALRVVVKYIKFKILFRKMSHRPPFLTQLSFSSMSIPLAISIDYLGFQQLAALPTMVVAVVISDLATVLLWPKQAEDGGLSVDSGVGHAQ